MTNEENKIDNIDQESEDNEHEMKEMGIKDLLKAFSDSPDIISDEKFKELEVIFSQAMNMSSCPCGSGTEYKFCCKPIWKFVERSFKEKQKESKKDAIKWIFKVGVGKDGLVLHTFDKKSQLSEIFEIISTVYNQTLVQFTTHMAMNSLVQMQQQAQAHKMASVGKDKSFRGL
ncbi:MAG: hypothetical protein ACTSW7_03765 [Candidatus Thorarchaeota archaeon]